ncbi:Lachesin, partial [Operophtera brumata]
CQVLISISNKIAAEVELQVRRPPIISDNSTRSLVASEGENRGTYYCVAENGVGKGARRNINLEVEFAPVVTVPRPRLAQVTYYKTLDILKTRHVLAWLRMEISHFATADEFTDTTIRVITIEKRQYGMFTCKAQNKLGTDEGRVELTGT